MIHFHRHSEFSRLDGVGTAQQYADRAKEMGQVALGLTDHGTLSGALHHVKACRDVGLIPISGVEAYFRPDRAEREKRSAWHLCLFAKNLRGWHSLLRITSIAYQDNREGGGFYQYPCVDWDLLETHSEGLMASTACISGWLAWSIKNGDSTGADQYLRRMKAIFGDDLWLEIMPHNFPEQQLVNVEIVNLAAQHSLPVIVTCDAHFPYKDWADTQQIVKLMSTSSSFEKKERELAKKQEKADDDEEIEDFAKLLPTAYLMDDNEIRALFKKAHPDLPKSVIKEAMANTELMAHTTTPYMLDKSNKMPKVTESLSEAEKIVMDWCRQGMERIGKTGDETYEDRLAYEFGVLKQNNACDYFVLVGRLCLWCREQNILYWLRGSAAGCLISYLVGISTIDPIPYGFLFERFMNPGRKGMPDIDIDVQHDRRDDVKGYFKAEYGVDHVADIISHQTFQPNKVLIDVARTFDVPWVEIEALSKAIDIRAEDEETTLEEIRPVNEEVDRFAARYPDVWKHSLRLEGMIANASKHAAGVLITKGPAIDVIALERGKQGDQVTSWSDRADFPAVSDHGFQKLDVLGIKGLTKQAIATKLIAERRGVTIDLDDLSVLRDPRDVDPKAMAIFRDGLTLGVWQFGSRGITSLLKQIKPDWVGDIIAANALYRPGPMGDGATWEYGDLKKMPPEEIVYWDDSVEFALAETFGLVAYQEQVMEICKALGGFSPGQADDMRKAMGKLYRLPGRQAREYMAQFREQWGRGTKEHGLSPTQAQEIWEKILSFGGYGFNKSHAGSYALLAYRDAVLKAYFPAEFYCALLTWPPSTTQKNAKAKAQFIQAVVRESEAFGVKLQPPDINKSDLRFGLDDKEDILRFGLTAINDVGPAAARVIMDRRPFKDWEDFRKRVKAKEANVKVRDALLQSGACDCWGMRDEMSGNEITQYEKARLGIALTMAGEVAQHEELIRQHIHEMAEFDGLDDGREVICGGDVVSISTTVVKQGKQSGREMAFVEIGFGHNTWRCTFFPDHWDSHQDLVESGKPIMIVGRKDTYRSQSQVQVGNVVSLESWLKQVDREEARA